MPPASIKKPSRSWVRKLTVNDPLHLRTATKFDASSLAPLSIEVWLGTYLRRGVTKFFADFVLSRFSTARFEMMIEDDREWLCLSQNDDGIDCYIRITTDVSGPIEGCGTTEISTLYVQPRHHGQGIGKALLMRVLEQCRTSGAETVWLKTNAENTPAIGFYLAMGFKQIGVTPFHIQNEAYENKVLSLTLKP